MSDSERPWTGFSRYQVPTAIVRGRTLLGGAEAVVLLALYKQANARRSDRESEATVHVSIKRLVALTGLADRTVRRAIDTLETKKFLTAQHTRKKHDSQFGSNIYGLLDPEDGKPLKSQAGKGVCYLNGIRYFPVPTDLLNRVVLPPCNYARNLCILPSSLLPVETRV